MQQTTTGVIYILTNPSFPDYVKIGYADDVIERVNQLNRSECTPFAFRVYATYEVNERLSDLKIHNIIDKLNPNLRSIDNIEGKKRVREFYAMSPEDAYEIFEAIAEIENFSKPSKKEIVGQAIIDLGGGTEKDDTLYQRYRKLSKLVTQRQH